MSDDHMKVGIDLDVHASGEELIDALTRKINNLNRQLKSINSAASAVSKAVSTPGRTASPAKDGAATRSAKGALGFDHQAVTALRQKLSLQGRLANQQARQEREALASFKARMSFQAKDEAQDVAAIRTKATEEARSFRQRMSFTSRMGRLAINEERKAASERARSVADAARQEARRSRDVAASIRANARLESAENRRVDRERSAHDSARSRNVSRIRSGADDVRQGAGQAVRGAGAMSAVAAAGTGAAVRRGISTRMEVDFEETSLRIFSGQTQAQIVAARKAWLDNLSVTNGASIAEGIKTYGEVLKAGIKGADQVTESIMKGAVGLELNVKETTKLAGLIDRNYGSASSPEKLKSALNAVAVAAREDPTQSNEIVEGVKRGFGALSTGNMTPEELTALVSGGQSVGIQPRKAGTFVATQAKRMSEGASKFLGPKQRKELDYAARELGFGNARSMAQAYAKESYRSIMTVNEKLAGMAPDKRAQVADALYGTQWSDEGLQMSQGVEGVRKTHSEIIDPKNSRFLDEAAQQRAASLQGQWNSTKAIFGRFWDAFGSGFEDILTSFNRYFFDLNSSFDYSKVKGYVSDFMTGVRDAFAVSTWKEAFQAMFGGNLGNLGADIKAFAKGLTEGILSIARGFRSILSVFSGGDMSADTIGRLSGQFVALSIALVALAPVVSILGGLISIITGLAIAGRGLAGLAGLGAVGAGAAGAGLMRGLGLALSRMFALSVVAEIGANRGVISTLMLDGAKALLTAVVEGIKGAFTPDSIRAAMKGLGNELIPAPIQRWLDSDSKLNEKNALPGKVLDGIGKPPVPTAPAERSILGKAWDWLTSSLVGSAHASEMEGRPPANGSASVKLTQAVNVNTAALKSSFESPVTGLGGLIQRASITGAASASAVRSSITDSAGQIRSGGVGAPVLSGSTAGGGFGLGPLAGSTPGSALVSGGGRLSSRGIIGGGLIPGSGGGSASSNPANSAASARMLDAIAGTESGKAGYDAVLGNGKYGTPSKPVSSMTLDEAFAFGRQVKSRHGSSSALGRYQIVGNTMRAAQRALEIDGNATFNAENQDRMARWIARSQGLGAWEGLKSNPHAMATARAAMAEGGATDAQSRSASLGAGVPSLGGAGQYDGLKIKGGQALAGGASYAGVTDLARQVQANLPGGVKHFSAFNDNYHKGTGSKHASGLAFDTTLIDGTKSSVAAEAIRNKIRSAGIRDDAFKVIDEYRNPSARSTGGHIHSQFNTAEAAKRYSDYIASLRQGAGGDIAAKAGEIKSSGWRLGLGGNVPNGAPSRNLGTDAPVRVGNTMPIGGGGAAGSGGHSSTTTNSITIQGVGQDAESIANAVQRKLNEKMARRTNDISPSLLSV